MYAPEVQLDPFAVQLDAIARRAAAGLPFPDIAVLQAEFDRAVCALFPLAQ
jgi:hypothetical protein